MLGNLASHLRATHASTQCRAVQRVRLGSDQSRRVTTSAEKQKHIVPRKRHICSTLILEQLLPSDYIDISDYHTPSVSWISSPDTVLLPRYRWGTGGAARFPANTRGFFYYGPRPGLPTIASSLRFRCTPSSNPASFQEGHDLLLPNGLPWQIITAQIANPGPTYLPVRTELLRSGLLTESSLAEWWKRFGPTKPSEQWHLPINSNILFSLNQIFPVNFQSHPRLQIFTTEMPRPYMHKMQLLFAWLQSSLRIRPFFGTAHAHFELSPTEPHLLHLRIAKITSPVGLTPEARAIGLAWEDEDGNVAGEPREGELFSVLRIKGVQRIEPWAMDLRKESMAAEALKMLVLGSKEGELQAR
ncbi:hypothetical protein FB45DRAFT_796416 [Roridomyces roridus]|uniref:Uncharacterized protein n=1 Tax=Roridomyces roridus TaxID=1738132 RepID=A0AAD7BLF4_9AGAR|nr:hypothetical protein FB45DRAFT_796416 [Roridomyces roridus]